MTGQAVERAHFGQAARGGVVRADQLSACHPTSGSTAHVQDEIFVVADSGSMIHVFPVTWMRQLDVVPVKRRDLAVRTAGGAFLKHFGEITVELLIEKGP